MLHQLLSSQNLTASTSEIPNAVCQLTEGKGHPGSSGSVSTCGDFYGVGHLEVLDGFPLPLSTLVSP